MRRSALKIWIIWLIIISYQGNLLQAQNFIEYEVSSAYLHHFMHFVEFPSETFTSHNSPFIIGIYGNRNAGVIIEKIIGNQIVNGRGFVFQYYDNPDEIKNCHLLFILKISHTELQAVLKKNSRKPILTVGYNISGFCQSGGIINFLAPNSLRRLEISNNKARKNNLIISSKLLSIANLVFINEVEF